MKKITLKFSMRVLQLKAMAEKRRPVLFSKEMKDRRKELLKRALKCAEKN